MKHRGTVGSRSLARQARSIWIICLGILLAFISAGVSAQSIERGSITGTITDPNGDRMPGVNVMLTSTELGATSETMTDANGRYRFVALLPSTYTVEASIEGFSTARQGDIELTVGKTLSVDLAMELGSVEDIIIVEGSPLIDVRSSTLQTTELNNEILMDVPSGRSIRSVVQLAPGIHSENAEGRQPSAFGSPGMGVQFSVDGVIINSPEAGESEVPLGFFSVEDVTVLGAGASAEYGGYSGVIVNVTTKQGSNDLNGMVDLQLADNDWQSQNTNDPDLQRSGSDRTDTEVHFDIGGPVQRDKAWFFTSFKYYQQDSQASGDHVNAPTNERPRFLGKINWTPTQEKIFSGMLEYSTRDQAYQGADEGDLVAPGATVSLEGTQYLFNFNYTDMLSQDTLLDLKFGGYHQRQAETPDGGDTPARYDIFEDRLSENWWGPFNANRERYQLIASVSHFTDDFIRGEHDFKFGVELQNTVVNTLNQYAGGKFYEDYAGENYILFESTGYDTYADTDKIVGYVQDSWGINDRVRLNLGLRANYWRGAVESDVNGVRFDPGDVFTPDLALAPRIGLNINLGDDNDSVLKAHWGRYYHQVISLFYSRLAPESDVTGYMWNADDEVWEHDFTEGRGPGQWTIDDNLGVPYMDALDVGWEKVLTRTVSLDVTATYRTNHDFLDGVNLTGEFEPTRYTDPDSGRSYNVFDQTNEGENRFYFTNVNYCQDYGQAYKELTCFKSSRKYAGITASLARRWRNNWQMQASWTYGEARGNNNNGWYEFQEGRGSSLGSSTFFKDPNVQINAYGNLTIDPTHLIKVLGNAQLPGGVVVGGYLRYFSGNTYNQLIRVEDVDQRSEIYGYPNGSFRLDDGLTLDLRVEKDFNLGGGRLLGVGIDVFNAGNADTVIEAEQTLNSDRPFGAPVRLIRGRVWRLGARLQF